MLIRAIAADELDAFLNTLSQAFGVPVLDEDEARHDKQRLEPDRCVVAIDDGQIVAVASAFSWRMVVPGGHAVPTAGVTAVGTLPSHRRRGLLRGLMSWLVDQAEEREEPLVALFASQAAIYGRLGFGRASVGVGLDITVDRAAFHTLERAGRVRLRTHDETLPLLGDIYRRALGERPGTVELTDTDLAWLFQEPADKDKRRFYAVHEDPRGVPDGVVVYRVKERWRRGLPQGEATVLHLLGTSPGAVADLWRFVIDLDLVTRVKTWDRPLDEPLQWLVQEPRSIRATLFDGLLARPVRTAQALASRGYAADGRLRLAVADAFRPANAGTFEVAVEGGRGTCARTDAEPDLGCSVKEIGALFLGGATWRELAGAGLVHEHTAGAINRADAMCRTPVPPYASWVF